MKPAVVIVDLQKGFLNRWTDDLPDMTAAFLERIGKAEVPVLGTRYVNHEGSACYRFEGWKECMEGTEDTELPPDLIPYYEQVFDKDVFSCWNDKMKNFIRERGIDKVYFAGVNTGCCVLASVFDCYNDLTDCAVISDLCGSTSGPEIHEAALTVLRSTIMKERVITADEAAEEILGI